MLRAASGAATGRTAGRATILLAITSLASAVTAGAAGTARLNKWTAGTARPNKWTAGTARPNQWAVGVCWYC
jgi:hypothetical protein